jgi:hypothetical protein
MALSVEVVRGDSVNVISCYGIVTRLGSMREVEPISQDRQGREADAGGSCACNKSPLRSFLVSVDRRCTVAIAGCGVL